MLNQRVFPEQVGLFPEQVGHGMTGSFRGDPYNHCNRPFYSKDRGRQVGWCMIFRLLHIHPLYLPGQEYSVMPCRQDDSSHYPRNLFILETGQNDGQEKNLPRCHAKPE